MCTIMRRLSMTFRRVSSVRRTPGTVEGHQNGAIERSRCGIDELCELFLAENSGQAIALLGIGSSGDAPRPLERLDVEEAEGAEMIGHRTGSQFVHGEELGLVLADVLRSRAIGRRWKWWANRSIKRI